MSALIARKLLVLSCLAVLNLTFGVTIEQLVLYGSKAKIEDYPYFAFLGNCGAAIISNRWLLTAAHCVNDTRFLQPFVEVGGETSRNNQRVGYDRIEMYNVQSINDSLPVHDIALIRLSIPLLFSRKVKPVALPTSALTSNRAVFAGRGKDESYRVSRKLMQVNFVRLTVDQCLRRIPRQDLNYARSHQHLYEKSFICARRQEQGQPSVCNGDSGSPLVTDNTVIGLLSFIARPCHKANLGFFVNVAHYVPWIKSVTGL